MRKFILSVAAICMAVNLMANGPEVNQDQKTVQQDVATDSTRTRAGVMVDSLALKSQRLGRKIADGTVETVDSIGVALKTDNLSRKIADGTVEAIDSISAASKRFGKKAAVWGDSISERSRRAWKAWNAGKEETPAEKK